MGLFRKNKDEKVAKSLPSALLLSIVIHVSLFLLAGMLVVFTVVNKEEQKFEPPPAIERPKMRLKKPKVQVKKTSRPRRTQNILAKPNPINMAAVQLPEGFGGGLGEGFDGVVGGFDLMPGTEEVSVFGGGQSIGNDFEGHLYDFKRDAAGRPIPMGEDMFKQKVREFVLSGWKPSKLSRYHRSPKTLYTTHFMMPPLPSPLAPDRFGDPEMDAWLFLMHYKGKLVSYEPITFRFWSTSDITIVRVNGEVVIVGCWPGFRDEFDFWQPPIPQSMRYILINQRATIGDWITLEPGKPLDMEIIVGEVKGGTLSSVLTVEVKGEEYERNLGGLPILPAFKTEEFSRDLIEEITWYLPDNEADLLNGPVFRDYKLSDAIDDEQAGAVEPSPAMEAEASAPEEDVKENRFRTWHLVEGETFDAEFISRIGERIVFKNEKGKIDQIPANQLAAEDLEFMQLLTPPDLDISFSKQSTQKTFKTSPYNFQEFVSGLQYVFSANIKQRSANPYEQELHAEVFAIGSQVAADDIYILLDRQEYSFFLNKDNDRSCRLSAGRVVEVLEYDLGRNAFGFQTRGMKYASFLVVVTDSRGKIIAHKTPKKWLFENYENLKEVPVGKCFDKTCSRTLPEPPKRWY